MNLTKKISFILIVSILSINLSFLVSPQKTNATGLPVVDIVGNALKGSKDIWDVLGKAGMELLSIATKSLARMLINEITNETVKWIGGLGDENNPPPSYVDIPKFLLKVEDRAIGDYIANNPNLDFLCDPFKNQIKIALGLNVGNPGHLFEGSDCSLTQISNNVRNSVNGGVDFQASLNLTADNKSATLNSTFSPPNDFSSSGGWDSWLALTTVPQNNIQGAYLIAQSDMNLNIQSAKGSKEIDIANGSGALSLRTCVDRYEDGNGNSYGTPSDQYFEGTQAPPPPSGGGTPVYGADEQGHGTVSYKGGVNVKTITDCTTKTPGRIVSSMLEKSVNADKNTTEMLAALGDGIDAIFNALTSKLFDVAMEQLKNGIFGDSTQRDNMNASIMEAASAESQRVQDQMNNDIQTFRDAYNTDGTQESLNALAFTMATRGSGGTGTTAGGSTGGTGEVSTGEFTANTGDNLYAPKNNAFTLINYYIKSETTYQSNYGIALNILTQAKKVFASSSACNFNLSGTTPVVRALMIRSEVITNIDGTQDSTRQTLSIPWNLITINSALNKSNANMTTLNYAGNTIMGASNLQTITDAMIPVNSTSFNTDVQAPLVGYVKDWLTRVQSNYNTPLCPIDLTEVLKIDSPAVATYY